MYQLVDLANRAGGGHNFGGGSHSSSSGGGSFVHSGGTSTSGASGGAGIFVLLVIVVVIIVIVVAVRKKGGSSKAPGTIGGLPFKMPFGVPGAAAPPPAAPAPDNVRAGIDAIRAHDPGFEDDKFISDAERAFFTVQQAWTELKPEMSRRVMNDNIWQQHRTQIEGYQSLNKRNVLEGLAIANARIISAECDGAFDTIVLRLLAGCADYDIDMSNNKVVRGNKNFTQWTEDWCFQRSSQATTKVNGGTMRQVCPNCGAPLDLDLQGVCKYCHAAVMSGQYDWVLTRIEQVNV